VCRELRLRARRLDERVLQELVCGESLLHLCRAVVFVAAGMAKKKKRVMVRVRVRVRDDKQTKRNKNEREATP